jgi:protein ImuB
MFACLHFPDPLPSPDALITLAAEFSPLFESTSADTVVLDMEGMERLLGTPREMASAMLGQMDGLHVAFASTPDVAVQAALRYPGMTVVAPGEEGRWLGPLELDRLPMTPEMAETLARWGIRTYQQFAELPEMGIAARFGQEGVYLQRVARGECPRPLIPWRPHLVFERSEVLEHPIDLLEPLLFVINRQLQEICAALHQSSLATNELHIALTLESQARDERVTRLPIPISVATPLLKLIHLDMDAHPPAAAIVAVEIRAVPVTPQRLQTGLFLPQAPEPAKLELTLKRIANLVGEEYVGTIEIPDTHRPGAFRLELRQGFVTEPSDDTQALPLTLALRVFRPPLATEVVIDAGRPAALRAAGIRGTVMHRAGPWRTAGDWWRSDAWDREEWDVGLSDRALYRIYWDRIKEGWFVEGRDD